MLSHPRLLLILLLPALPLAGCKKAEPVAVAKAPPAAAGPRKAAAPAGPRERGEYTEMPTGPMTYTVNTEKAYAAEAQRGGPGGEPRVFETPEEFNELSRGNAPKYMNGQFRYYLRNVTMVQPHGDCKTPLLAVNLVVENLHGTPAAAVYGEFKFTQASGGDGSALTTTVAVPFNASIIGPFSNKQGGFVFATAFLEPSDPVRDSERWAQIATVNPQRLKVWFRPDVIYYGDGTQYSPRTGKVAAQRELLTCGGSEGARALLK